MWCLERPLLAQGGALRAYRADVGGGSHLGPREAVLVYSCLRSHIYVVGDASGREGLWAPSSHLAGTEHSRFWEASGSWATGLALL